MSYWKNTYISGSVAIRQDVIVDATNLNENTIKRLEKTARLTKSEIKFITLKAGVTRSFIQVLWRTLLGGKFISYKVIKGFYNRYQKVKC